MGWLGGRFSIRMCYTRGADGLWSIPLGSQHLEYPAPAGWDQVEEQRLTRPDERSCKGMAMRKSKNLVLFLGLLALSLLFTTNHVLGSDGETKDVARITVDQLKSMLGRPDVVIVDVRDPISWDKSDSKIPGAVREDPDRLAAWVSKYPKDKTMVFYCA